MFCATLRPSQSGRSIAALTDPAAARAEIAALVYDLYDLSPAEIALVEAAHPLMTSISVSVPVQVAQLLDPAFLEAYEKQRDILWSELVYLNASLFLLEKLTEYPFQLFTPDPNQTVFWRLSKWSLLQTIVMTAYRIVTDRDGEGRALTLNAFRSHIIKHAVNAEAKSLITSRLRKVSFKKRVEDIEEKLKLLRDKRVAHLDFTTDISAPDELTVAELRTLIDAAIDLFHTLCFEHFHEVWFISYSQNFRAEERTDLDRLLLHVADSSDLLHLPETNPAFWTFRRSQLSVDDMRWINHYRAKLGLSPVP